MNMIRPSVGPSVRRIVTVTEFIEDADGKAVAINGVTFPDGRSVRVLPPPPPQTPGTSAPLDFEACRQGNTFRGPDVRLEPGGVLQINCIDRGAQLDAKWLAMMASNAEAAKRNLSLGHGSLALFIPEHLRKLHMETAKDTLAKNPKANYYEIARAYIGAVKGEPCYRGSYQGFDLPGIFRTDPGDLKGRLICHYAEERFRRVAVEGRSFEPISPGLIVRAMDDGGRVTAALHIQPEHLYKEGLSTPDQRASYVAEVVQDQLQGEGVVAYDCLPYDRRLVSRFSLTNDPEREWTMRGILSLVNARRNSSELVDGQHEMRAFRAAATFAGNGMVTDVVVPTGEVPVEAARLTQDGSLMAEAQGGPRELQGDRDQDFCPRVAPR
ncbi:MAG: hypothetical protein LBR22_01960 [Desulfovibrio sp.]|jgi:hypothetical protein|nr:hypothetical protein [Desulfovibrio sp.]